MMNLREPHLQLFGLAMLFYVVVTLGFSAFFELVVKRAKENIKAPVMALEFVRKAGDVEKITRNDPEARDGLKTFLLLDAFAFVPLYFAFLLVMSFFLSLISFDWARTAAAAVVFAAIAAAAADWTENFYSYKVLDTVFSGPEENVSLIFWAAHIKWVLIFVATGILSAIFWRGGYWWNIAGIILSLTSLGGLICLFAFRAGIVFALMAQLAVLFIAGLLFMFSSACRTDFLQNL